MIFSSDRVKKEWASKTLSKNTRSMVEELVSAMEELSIVAVITCVYRSEEENHLIYQKLGLPFAPSTHTYWRAVDLVPENKLYWEMVKKLCADLNAKNPYGKEGKLTYLVHDIGLGQHVHIQTME